MMNKNKKEILIVVVVVIAVIAIAAIATVVAAAATNTSLNAQILEKDDIPTLPLDGNATLGEVDVSVDIEDAPMPANGTISLSTAGATDIDIQSMPPAGFTILIDNQTATVTLHPVAIQADTSADDSPSTDSSNGGSGGDAEDE